MKKLMLVVVGILALAASPAKAEETWLVATVASHHFDSAEPKDYEQRNLGVGVEHQFTENTRLIAGFYRNSLRRETFYFGGAGALWRYGPITLSLTFALASGYEDIEVKTETGPDGKERKTLEVRDTPLPAIFPVISVEGRRFGVNLAYFPKYGNNMAAAGLQLKYRWR